MASRPQTPAANGAVGRLRRSSPRKATPLKRLPPDVDVVLRPAPEPWRSGPRQYLPPFEPLPTLLVFVAALVLVAVNPRLPSITGPPAETKPFDSFAEFYPHYLKEHVPFPDSSCRAWHIFGASCVILAALVLSPSALPARFLTARLGFLLADLMRGSADGRLEGPLLLLVFLAVHQVTSGGKLRVGLLIIFLDYAGAWIGHWMQGNQPATFVAPSYSMAGDMVMYWDVLTGAQPL